MLFRSTQRFSIVNRHESNGVERVNKEILKHLRFLVNVERVRHKWANDSVLPIIQFIINSTYNRDSGTAAQNFSAFALTFGTLCHERFDLPKFENGDYKTEFVKRLNDNFKTLHAASLEYQNSLRARREDAKSKSSVATNLVPGEIVVKCPNKLFRQAKLSYFYRSKSVPKDGMPKIYNLLQGFLQASGSNKSRGFYGNDA